MIKDLTDIWNGIRRPLLIVNKRLRMIVFGGLC